VMLDETLAPTRPVFRYFGGKWRIAPWIIGFFPPHRVYVEPFGGGASVLLRKPRSPIEVYNDMDGEVVNVFRVLRDPAQAAELHRLLTLTPYARSEYAASQDDAGESAEPVERALRTICRAAMGFGTNTIGRARKGFRVDTRNVAAAQQWVSYFPQVERYVARLQGVLIEQRDASAVCHRSDDVDTLHYVDPPYPHGTRGSDRYRHDMTDADHHVLAAGLHALQGAVVLSGYACPLYDDELFPDWERHTYNVRADNAGSRTEVVWLNHACVSRLRDAANTDALFSDGTA